MDPRMLPIREYTDKIVNAVRNNSVTIVIGETGSGKTTQISQVNPPVPSLEMTAMDKGSLMRPRQFVVKTTTKVVRTDT